MSGVLSKLIPIPYNELQFYTYTENLKFSCKIRKRTGFLHKIFCVPHTEIFPSPDCIIFICQP